MAAPRPILHLVAPDPEALTALVRAPLQADAHDGEHTWVAARNVYDRYASYVAAVAMRLLGRDDEIEDVVQDVFVAALTGLASVRDTGAIKGWLATITVRFCTSKLRRRRLARWLHLDRDDAAMNIIDPALSGEERASLACVYRELDRMPSEDRVAWTLRHIQDCAADEVALFCGCSLATAKRRIARADARVRKVILDE